MDSISENMKKRAQIFVKEFVKEFKSFIEYNSKILCGEEPTTSSTAKIAENVILSLTGAVGLGFAGKAANFGIRKLDVFNQKNEAVKRENIIITLEAAKEKLNGYLIDAALDIFQSFEMQFLEVVSMNGSITEAMTLLAKDAAKKLENHLEKLDGEIFEIEKLSKYILEGKLDNTGNEIKKNTSNKETWKTGSLFDKVGIVTIEKINRYNFYKNNTTRSEKYGHRRGLLSESVIELAKEGKLIIEKEKYELEESFYGFEKFNYKFSKEILNELKKEIIQDIDTEDSVLLKNLRESDEKTVNEMNKALKESEKVIRTEIENAGSKLGKVLESIDTMKREIETLKVASKTIKPFMHNFRFPVKPFIGRGDMLKKIHETLGSDQKNQAHIALTAVTSGLGGIGKTELARQYASVYKTDAKFYTNIIWITAESAENINEEFKRLLEETFQINDVQAFDTEKLISVAYENLEKCGRTLIVFDNAEDSKDLQKFLYRKNDSNNLRFLITSRITEWLDGNDGTVEVFKVDVFSESEAKEFVTEFLNIKDESQSEDIRELIELLQYFPLALNQAVSFIKQKQEKAKKWKNKYFIKDYIELVNKDGKLEALNRSSGGNDRYKHTVLTTWSATLKILQKSGTAVQLLQEFAYMLPDKIDIDSIYEMNDEIIEAIELLDRFSMVKLLDGVVSIHRLVQEVLKSEHKSDEFLILQRLLQNLHKNAKENLDHLPIVWKFGVKYIDLIREYHSKFEGIIDDLIDKVKYAEAVSFAELIIDPLEKLFGIEDLNILNIKRSYGVALLSQLKFFDSFKVLQNVLSIQNRKLGELHPDTLLTMFEYACCIDEMGAHDTALILFHDILVPIDVARNFSGCSKLWKCNVKDRIGEIWTNNCYHKTAEVFLKQSLEEKKLKYGCDHPEYFYTKKLLELTYAAYQNNLVEDVEKIIQSKNSYHHPKNLKILEKTAQQLFRAKENEKCLKFYEVIYEQSCQIYGKNDPKTLNFQGIIAKLSHNSNVDNNNTGVSSNVNQFEINILSNINARDTDEIEIKCLPFVDLLNLMPNELSESFVNYNLKDLALAYLRQKEDLLQKRYFPNSGVVAEGKTECHQKIGYNDATEVSKFLEQNLNLINEQDIHGNTPLMWACIKGDQTVIKKLIEMGANIYLKNFDGLTALHWAIRSGQIKIIQLLVNAKGDERVLQTNYLHESVKNVKVLELLLKEELLDPEELDKSKNTPLMWATFIGQIDSMDLLLKLKVNINAKNIDNRTALHWAILDAKTLKWLHTNHVDINSVDNSRWTLIHEASMYRNLKIMKAVLEVTQSKNINKKSENGSTPIKLACQEANLEVVEYLFNLGADVNLANYDGISPLFSTTYYGHTEIIRWLLEKGADVTAVSLHGVTILHGAAFTDNVENLKLIIKSMQLKGAVNVNVHDDYGETPMKIACLRGNINVAKHLFELGADFNLATHNGYSPLYSAASNGHLKVVKWLLDNGANYRAMTHNGFTILHGAAFNDNVENLELIIDSTKSSGSNSFNVQDANGNTMMYISCQEGNLGIARCLFNLGADVNLKNYDGFSPLLVAAQNGHSKVVQWLIEKGADVNAVSNIGLTVLHGAAFKDDIESLESIIKSLISQNSDKINSQDSLGDTPIKIACQKGNINVVKHLLNLGADVNLSNNQGYSPLYSAAENGHLKVVQWLKEKGADIKAKTKTGITILHGAAFNENVESLDSIIQSMRIEGSVNLNVQDHLGNTPMLIACQEANLKVSKRLFNLGADINLKNHEGFSSLYWAAGNGHSEMVKWLLQKGADINAVINTGRTILHGAAFSDDVETVEFIIKSMISQNSVNFNVQDADGNTPMLIACKKGNINVAKCLLNFCADINLANYEGLTPLHFAASNGHLKVVKWLLDNGAHINTVSNLGDTVLHEVALADNVQGLVEIVKILIQKGLDFKLKNNKGKTALDIAIEKKNLLMQECLKDL